MIANTYDRRQFSRHDLTIDSIEHELAIAGKIQRSFFPSCSQCLGCYELAGNSISCTGIGGDYFDFFLNLDCPHQTAKIVVADVSGHGIDAALLMSSARAFIRSHWSRSKKPDKFISKVNRHFCLDNTRTGHFMTLFYLDVDLDTGNGSWVRAGHDPALLLTPDLDKFYELKGFGLPIGVDCDYCYNAYQFARPPEGTIIAIGTDGIWNAINEDGEFFSKDRFKELLRISSHLSAEEIVDVVFQELAVFCKNVPLDDDITLVIIKALASNF
ncbi:PP2C family protein-serine/threonine phosphatase [Desulfopila aestuarii]|uniref:Stage II sporulation protein E (SpoIIE) n=1 Tax=Desulfopila aestuarii DSM 18488 TaxID=1121416 RepID=A0A1M7XYV7_9BACT|nr:PP2C family protein-serine/threonine phosphatase [Desulfopila aestuarii]SHO44209.1 Stage II sporulation protein E (SpoIIE) [Desulfopila aestuarii DSM 18488]